MANYENSRDLKEDVLRHSGELVDGTSEYNDTVMIFMNRAQQALLSGAADLGMDVGQPWPWAKSPYPGILIIDPAIRTILSNVVNGSNIVTFTAPVTFSLNNYYINFGDDSQVYRISSHLKNTTTARLDSVFIGDTANAYETRVIKYDYTLNTGILRLIGPMSATRNSDVDWDGKIEMIDQSTFNRDYSMGVRLGVPDRFAQIYKDNDMQITVRFNRVPSYDDRAVRLEYDYIPVPDDLIDDPSSIPVVPRDHRIALVYYAAYYLLLDKNDSRAAEFRELARASIMALVRAYKVEKSNTNMNYGRMIPRSDGNSSGYFKNVWRGYK